MAVVAGGGLQSSFWPSSDAERGLRLLRIVAGVLMLLCVAATWIKHELKMQIAQKEKIWLSELTSAAQERGQKLKAWLVAQGAILKAGQGPEGKCTQVTMEGDSVKTQEVVNRLQAAPWSWSSWQVVRLSNDRLRTVIKVKEL